MFSVNLPCTGKTAHGACTLTLHKTITPCCKVVLFTKFIHQATSGSAHLSISINHSESDLMKEHGSYCMFLFMYHASWIFFKASESA